MDSSKKNKSRKEREMELRWERIQEGKEEIIIRAYKMTKSLEKFIHDFKQYSMELYGKKEDCEYRIPIRNVYYIEVIDGKCFLYEKEEFYESQQSLKEFESRLKNFGFVRISKSCILNCRKLKGVKADKNHRMKVFLLNGECLIVNRTYLASVKEMLKKLSEEGENPL